MFIIEMNAIDRYTDIVLQKMQASVANQRPAIEQAAALVGDALLADRYLYAFGTGHSHMLAEEIFYRAGGLARAAPIFDSALMLHESASASSLSEQRTGYAERLLARYPVAAGDVLILASNSGRNAVPVEMALAARDRGLRAIGITSLAHSAAFPSRHPSGKRLLDVVDVVLDNLAEPGDAALALPGLPRRIGPTSTLTGVLLLNLIVVRGIELALERGHVAEVYASSNADVPGWNERLLEHYRSRVRHL